jgi:hypothetical protein
MATIAELAQMSANVYDGTSSATQDTSSTSPPLVGLSDNENLLHTASAQDTCRRHQAISEMTRVIDFVLNEVRC